MKVLVVDDEAAICYAFESIIEDGGDAPLTAGTAARGRAVFESEEPDLVFLDVRLPDANGIELLRLLREQAPDTPVVVMTAHGGFEVAVEAMQAGAWDYLVKPIAPEQVRGCIARVRARAGTRARGGAAERAPRRLIGRSPAIQAIFKDIGILAASPEALLIQGESGTGKELVARALHDASPSRSGPFEPVDCASLPAELVEAELFGHARGAFTGAESARPGRVRVAEGGTLFLDEIGELPLRSQPKLLRFLAEREVSPVGGGPRTRVNVRVIAATNRDLAAEVEAGRFRADLYYRLSVLTIALPPLRDRRDDIPLLVEHFLESWPELRGASDEVIAKLQAWSWPGNIRELNNVIAHAATFARGDRLELGDLPANLRAATPSAAATGSLEVRARRLLAELLDEALEGDGSPHSDIVGMFDRWLIEEALERCGGSRSAASRMLQLNRATLRKRLVDEPAT